MSFDREDLKRGIDSVAASLKDTVDEIADKTSGPRHRVSEKGKEIARRAGDEMIEQGHKLRNAAGGESGEADSKKIVAPE